MTNSIVITLDSIKKYRNKDEYRTIQRASWMGHEATGDGPVIQQLCSIILENYPDSKETPVEVYRGTTLCFNTKTLEQWATGKGLNNGRQPHWLKKS